MCKFRIPTIVLFASWFLFGCSAAPGDMPAPESRPDPITYCDYCSVDFRAPDCLTGGMVTACPTPDGTWWQWSANNQGQPDYRRFRVVDGQAQDLCICNAEFCGATFK